MLSKLKTCFLVLLAGGLAAQETDVIKKTDIYLQPGKKETVMGQLLPGTTVTKLKKDKSGQYIKATIEFYIPLETLEEGRVSKRVGELQVADDALFRLVQARREENTVRLSLQITNQGAKSMDFAPLVLLKVVSRGGINGELNPFQGQNQGFVTIGPHQTVTAELYYDFQAAPAKAELMCTARPGGDRVYYLLGF